MHWKATFIASIRDIQPVCVVSTEPVGQVVSRLSHKQLTSSVALASGKNPQWSSRIRKDSSASEIKGAGVFSNVRKPEYRRDIRRDFCMTKQTLLILKLFLLSERNRSIYTPTTWCNMTLYRYKKVSESSHLLLSILILGKAA